jgi:toxin ParE1/3/4
MPYKIEITEQAIRDLEELYDYIYLKDVPGKVEYVIDKIESIVNELVDYPNRGVYPIELREIGIKEFREVFFKPYRIIYRIIKDTIYIMLITDGRRDMQALLQRRLLND